MEEVGGARVEMGEREGEGDGREGMEELGGAGEGGGGIWIRDELDGGDWRS